MFTAAGALANNARHEAPGPGYHHVFVELKCIPAGASSRAATSRDFHRDVVAKLARMKLGETVKRWQEPNDHWCEAVAPMSGSLTTGPVHGIGILVVGDAPPKMFQTIREKLAQSPLVEELFSDDPGAPSPTTPAISVLAFAISRR